jgi:hypothetical protein
VRNVVQEDLNGFGWDINEMKEFDQNMQYKNVKRKYEKTICKILTPNVVYLRFKEEGVSSAYDVYSHDAMKICLKPVFYLKKKESDTRPTKERFFNAWTDDITARSYNSLVFDPSIGSIYTKKGDLNVWPGFLVATYPPIEDPQLVESLVQPIVSHIQNVVVSGALDHAEWLLDWMANIVKMPERKTEVPIVISGKQGIGKGIIFDFFRLSVLGKEITAQIQNPGQDLFSRFSNKHVNKVFLQMDEGEGLAKYADQLKNLTTCGQINYEIKGVMSSTCNNYINILITTNHEKPVLVETSDRRFVLFRASDIYLKNPEYYAKLGNHLKSKEVARAFYQFLMLRDVSKYISNFQSTRPMTEYYIQSRQSSISTIHKFISGILNNHYNKRKGSVNNNNSNSTAAQKKIPHNIFFKDFVRFLENGRYQSTMTLGTFISKVKNIKGIEMTDVVDNDNNNNSGSSGGPYYILHLEDIRQALIENNEYDPDIYFE